VKIPDMMEIKKKLYTEIARFYGKKESSIRLTDEEQIKNLIAIY
jgi:hypothetical protein